MIGVRGRGNSLAQGFLSRGDCRIAYVCDVDRRTGESRAGQFAQRQGGKPPKFEQDFRKMLDDKSVDAVVIATPDHWHAPAAVWSCQASKDVYIEKPPTHNCWEGRQMIAAARKYKRVVQVGIQNRSAPYNMDMWNGPAPQHKYNATLHRHWHHLWRYSGGDMANDGVHQMDLARWLVGVDYPQWVCCGGGRFNSPGAPETPDTQIATFQFPELVMTFELTLYTPYMLKTDGGIRQSDMIPYWPLPRPGSRRKLRPVHPQPETTQRRHPGRPSQRAAGPLREHLLSPGRAETGDRPPDGEDRRRRSGHGAVQAELPRAVGNRGRRVREPVQRRTLIVGFGAPLNSPLQVRQSTGVLRYDWTFANWSPVPEREGIEPAPLPEREGRLNLHFAEVQ